MRLRRMALAGRPARAGLALAMIAVTAAAAPPLAVAQPPAETPAPGASPAELTLTLRQFLSQVNDRLLEVRQLDLRRQEAEAELAHVRQSRAFEVDMRGQYREEDFHRVEVNGGNVKSGRTEDIRRTWTFAITRPLLGMPLEQRLIVVNEQQRIAELEEATILAKRDAFLEVIGIYVDTAAEQRLEPLRARAIALERERVRILEARHRSGEALRQDVLAAEVSLARREVDAATSHRLVEELRARLGELLDGAPPPPFQAVELHWPNLAPDALAAAIGDADSTAPQKPAREAGISDIWYALPEVDLTFYYTMESRDRRFADEYDQEDGHTPGLELSIEFPLDAFRAGRSFARQAKARAERQRIALEFLERQTDGQRRRAAMAHIEAQAMLVAAEAELALRAEEHRVTQLRAQDDAGTSPASAALTAISAELQVIDARAALGEAQGDLAQCYFERAMLSGVDALELAAAASGPDVGSLVEPAGTE
jgi:outer membrane protein TolC